MKASLDFTVNRIETFSDGVFAIVVTLLVFDLRFPHINNPINEKCSKAEWVLYSCGLLIGTRLSWVNSWLAIEFI